MGNSSAGAASAAAPTVGCDHGTGATLFGATLSGDWIGDRSCSTSRCLRLWQQHTQRCSLPPGATESWREPALVFLSPSQPIVNPLAKAGQRPHPTVRPAVPAGIVAAVIVAVVERGTPIAVKPYPDERQRGAIRLWNGGDSSGGIP